MKFYIAIEEKRSTVVEVEADSVDEALLKTETAYSEDEICLNDDDYIDDGTCFYNETSFYDEGDYATNFQKIK